MIPNSQKTGSNVPRPRRRHFRWGVPPCGGWTVPIGIIPRQRIPALVIVRAAKGKRPKRESQGVTRDLPSDRLAHTVVPRLRLRSSKTRDGSHRDRQCRIAASSASTGSTPVRSVVTSPTSGQRLRMGGPAVGLPLRCGPQSPTAVLHDQPDNQSHRLRRGLWLLVWSEGHPIEPRCGRRMTISTACPTACEPNRAPIFDLKSRTEHPGPTGGGVPRLV